VELVVCTRRRLLVVFPIAERTITGVSSGKLRMRSATSLIRSADATEDPPNFITTVNPAAAGGVPPSDTAGAGAGASPLFRVVVAAAPLWQRSTSPLRAQHCPPGLALAAARRGHESLSLASLQAERAAGASGTTAAKRSAAIFSRSLLSSLLFLGGPEKKLEEERRRGMAATEVGQGGRRGGDGGFI
jgi:hypothetical protein